MKYALHLVTLLLTLVMVGCSSTIDEDYVVDDHEGSATALDFAAYVTRYSRDAATEKDIADVKALAQAGGFGVVGYAHGQRKFDEYVADITVPTFLVNQQVWDASQEGQDGHKGSDVDATGTWKYAPVKYYDNNADALHSFFAYAPYRQDADIVYVSGKAPQLRHNISKDIDLLWAKPRKNLPKPGTEKKVTFNFSHALTKTTFHVAPFIDEEHTGHTHADTDHTSPISHPLPATTTVRVRSIHLNGIIPYTGLLNTESGEWTPGTTGQYFDVPGANKAQWTGDGTTVPAYHLVQPSSKLIPTQRVSIEVIYDIISQEGPVTHHVTRKAVSHETFDLVRGNAYHFYLDLGLNTVKFFATVGDWTDEDHTGEIPDDDTPVLLETVLTTILPWQAGVSDDQEW